MATTSGGGWRCRAAVAAYLRLTVVGTVRRHGGDHAVGLPKQGRHLAGIVGGATGQDMGGDLARVGVDDQMQLAPLSKP